MSGLGRDNYSQEQAFSYRRGFVLGLTLAEAAILIIFIILLLLVIGFDRRDAELVRLSGAQAQIEALAAAYDSDPQALEALVSNASIVESILAEAGFDFDDDFIELIRGITQANLNGDLRDAVSSLRDARDILQRSLEKFSQLGDPEELSRLLEAAEVKQHENRNLRGQVNELRSRLANAGLGGVLPSCWVTEEGRIVYLLDTVLYSQGIKIRDLTPPERLAERALLPLRAIPSVELLSPADFLNLTRELFAWSVANECRFYVNLYDGTAAHEKELFIDLMLTVEGHFYKRQSRNDPPF